MRPFDDFCEAFFQKYFALHPAEAIHYSIDGYDHLLTDYSDETYTEDKAFWKDSLQHLRQVSVKGLTKDETIDYALLEGRLTIENYEFNKEDYRLKQPDIYLPVSHIYILTVRPTKDRLGNILSRLEQSPKSINQGITNLSRPDANPPRLWTEMAIEAAKGGVTFLDTLPSITSVAEGLKDPAHLKDAIEKAKGIIRDFTDFLERDLLPRSRGSYPVGEEHYHLLLKKRHFLTHDAGGLLTFGERLLQESKSELAQITEEIAPGKGIAEVTLKIQEHHPPAGDVISAYQNAMESARTFVLEKKLLSFPPHEKLRVVHTP